MIIDHYRMGLSGPSAVTLLVSTLNGAGGPVYASDSYTPPANTLLLAFVAVNSSTASAPPLTGNGLTWVNIGFYTNATTSHRIAVYRALGASPTAGSVTATYTVSQGGCSIFVVSVTGASTSGTNGSGAIVQIDGASADGSTTAAVTLAPLAASGANAVIACVVDNILHSSDNTPEAGWTELVETSLGSPNTGIQIVYRLNTTDNTVTTTASARSWVMAAVEIQ